MDAAHLALAGVLVVAGFVLASPMFASVGQAADGMATLFVPPDRALGWPRGVQEIDDPWAWQVSRPAAPIAVGSGDGVGDGISGDAEWVVPAQGAFVVPLAPVDPVHLTVRPH